MVVNYFLSLSIKLWSRGFLFIQFLIKNSFVFPMFKLSQIWPLGNPFGLVSICFWYNLINLGSFLTFGRMITQAYLIPSLPKSGIGHFCKSPDSFREDQY